MKKTNDLGIHYKSSTFFIMKKEYKNKVKNYQNQKESFTYILKMIVILNSNL